MPIEKITFEKLMPTMMYGNEKFIMEGTVGPDETKESLYDEMYQTAIAQFYRNNPHFKDDYQFAVLKANDEFQVNSIAGKAIFMEDSPQKKDSILEGINNCDGWTGEKGLRSYELLVKNNATWKQAFDDKKKQLGLIG